MEADPISPVAPARVRLLLVPIGQLKARRFVNFVKRLRAETIVRLGDISPDAGPDRQTFSPLAFPNGSIIYNIVTSSSDELYYENYLFETFREPLVIVGVVDGQNDQSESSTDHGEIQNRDASTLLALMTRNRVVLETVFPRAITHHMLLFDLEPNGTLQSLPAGCTAIPSAKHSTSTSVKTAMCDVSAHFLSNLAVFARHVQNLDNILTPAASSSQAAWTSNLFQRASTSSDANEGSPRPSSPESTSSQRKDSSLDLTFNVQPPVRSTSPWDAPRPTSAPAVEAGSGSKEPTNEVATFPTRPGTSVEAFTGRESRTSKSKATTSFDERSKIQLKARQEIVLGSLFLHAGRWADAMRELVDGTARARVFGDHYWYAKGLENIIVTMLLLLWANIDFTIPSICRQAFEKSSNLRSIPSNELVKGSKSSEVNDESRTRTLSEVCGVFPDLLKAIADTYTRKPDEVTLKLPQVVISECIIRLGKGLAYLFRANGKFTDRDLDSFVRSTNLKLSTRISSHNSKVTKADVVEFIFRAYPTTVMKTAGSALFDTVTILSGIISVLTIAQSRRKQSVMVRELLELLLPQLIQARKVGAAEAGIHPAASLAALHGLNVDASVGSLSPTDEGIRQSFHNILTILCESFGVVQGPMSNVQARNPLQNGSSSEDSEGTPQPREMLHLATNLGGRLSSNFDLKADILRLSANFSEALPNFADVVHFSAMLLGNAAVGGAPKLIGGEQMVLLDHEDQLRCSLKINRTLSTVRANDVANLETVYWDDFMIRDVQLKPQGMTERLLQFRSTDFQDSRGSEIIAQENNGPFIHTSIKPPKVSAKSESVLLKGIQSSFTILLQNLYDFDVVIEDIALLYRGETIIQSAQPTVLGPSRLQEATVFVTAESTGTLKVYGCSVKIQGCRRKDFLIFSKPYCHPGMMNLKEHHMSSVHEFSDERPQSTSNSGFHLPQPQSLTFDIVPAQPQLSITADTLLQGILSIVEGETKAFNLTVRNVSNIVVDLVRISFEYHEVSATQSHSRLIDTIGFRESKPSGRSFPSLRWINESQSQAISIPPGKDAKFSIEALECFGVIGATLYLDYANSPDLLTEMKSDQFKIYGRRISLPFTINASPAVTLQRFNVLRLRNSRKNGYSINDADGDKGGSCVTKPKNPHTDDCMIVLDLRNMWSRPIQISVTYADSPYQTQTTDELRTSEQAVSKIVQPNHVARIMLIVDDLMSSITENYESDETRRNSKDFHSKRSTYSFNVADSQPMRSDLSEILLTRLQGRWTDLESRKCGLIDLKSAILSDDMLKTVHADELKINVELASMSTHVQKLQRDQHVTFETVAGESLVLRASLSNQSNRQVQPLMTLEPRLKGSFSEHEDEIGQALIWDGLLQKVGPVIQPGESNKIEWNIGFVCPGQYEVLVFAESYRSGIEASTFSQGDNFAEMQTNWRSVSDSELRADSKDCILGRCLREISVKQQPQPD